MVLSVWYKRIFILHLLIHKLYNYSHRSTFQIQSESIIESVLCQKCSHVTLKQNFVTRRVPPVEQ
jgi:formylmethanofuran dehydrogenase subunit E